MTRFYAGVWRAELEAWRDHPSAGERRLFRAAKVLLGFNIVIWLLVIAVADDQTAVRVVAVMLFAAVAWAWVGEFMLGRQFRRAAFERELVQFYEEQWR